MLVIYDITIKNIRKLLYFFQIISESKMNSLVHKDDLILYQNLSSFPLPIILMFSSQALMRTRFLRDHGKYIPREVSLNSHC